MAFFHEAKNDYWQLPMNLLEVLVIILLSLSSKASDKSLKKNSLVNILRFWKLIYIGNIYISIIIFYKNWVFYFIIYVFTFWRTPNKICLPIGSSDNSFKFSKSSKCSKQFLHLWHFFLQF